MNTAPPIHPSTNGSGGLPDPGRERLFDLLTSHATEGLEPHEAREMAGLLRRHPDVDPEMLELAAASAAVAMLGDEDRHVQLPESLRRKLRAGYRADGQTRGPIGAVGNVPFQRPDARRFRLGPLAMAAAVGVVSGAALMGLLARPGGAAPSTGSLASADAPGTTRDAMERFATSVPDAVRIRLKGAAAGFEAAAGEVVWSDREQTGYFRVANLKPNDRTVSQYQLWIVDPSRDSKPVDGGVFDVPPGESVVRIAAKLRVDKPAVFAITKEKPGGVVVSAGPLLVVASR